MKAVFRIDARRGRYGNHGLLLYMKAGKTMPPHDIHFVGSLSTEIPSWGLTWDQIKDNHIDQFYFHLTTTLKPVFDKIVIGKLKDQGVLQKATLMVPVHLLMSDEIEGVPSKEMYGTLLFLFPKVRLIVDISRPDYITDLWRAVANSTSISVFSSDILDPIDLTNRLTSLYDEIEKIPGEVDIQFGIGSGLPVIELPRVGNPTTGYNNDVMFYHDTESFTYVTQNILEWTHATRKYRSSGLSTDNTPITSNE